MGTITPSRSEVKGFGEYANIIVWEALSSANDTGLPVEMPGSHIRSVQIVGTFDSCTVVIEGSNDGVNYVTLTDPQANSLSKTSAALEAVQELTRYIRAKVTSAGASTDIDVYLLVKRVH